VALDLMNNPMSSRIWLMASIGMDYGNLIWQWIGKYGYRWILDFELMVIQKTSSYYKTCFGRQMLYCLLARQYTDGFNPMKFIVVKVGNSMG